MLFYLKTIRECDNQIERKCETSFFTIINKEWSNLLKLAQQKIT